MTLAVTGALFFWWAQVVRGAPTALACFFVVFRRDFVTSVRVSVASAGFLTLASLRPAGARNQARIQGGGGRWVRRPPLGRRDPRRRRGFLRLKGREKGHRCPLNGYLTPFKHAIAINILKNCKSVLAYMSTNLCWQICVWFGLVRIRPFRSDLTISEPWDEGARIE